MVSPLIVVTGFSKPAAPLLHEVSTMHFAAPMVAADISVPRIALRLAIRASLPRSKNLGKAVADNMPRMTMTEINSISVKPD